MYKLLALPDELDTRPLRQALWAHHIGHRFTRQESEQILWIADPDQRDDAAKLIELWHRGELEQAPAPEGRRRPGVTRQAFGQAPLAAGLIAACVVVFLAMTFAGNAIIKAFTIVPVEVIGQRLVPGDLVADTLAGGQIWRLITPAFLHFGWMHLIFNMLWVWYFGRQIEAIQGWKRLAGVTLVAAVASNLVQYFTGTVLFGGMSGVDYALLGYVFLMARRRPGSGFFVPQMLVVFMLIWMVFTMTDLAGAFGFGNVANEAHLGGLLVGLILGWWASRHATGEKA
ncbi:rhomboid family intramembrane serine protease [Salinicola rhizosphaerae]|uniref:Rhomboid family intramembrane serine protease n=1 Tax=Salinicola rhizosphaerae TaxID=1443141 RepID=A0ABQ3EC08_9GAMM|nr:rhomboid family intramembrane serine protease [Salinicola rhizosphaerae]GHB30129.1 rhomboid family intramembrane serine protease [Salinicola rhizosphaerae]